MEHNKRIFEEHGWEWMNIFFFEKRGERMNCGEIYNCCTLIVSIFCLFDKI
jgi:hypothetical protein